MSGSDSWNSACPTNDNHRLWSHNLGSRYPPQNSLYTVRRVAVRPTFRNYQPRPLTTLLPGCFVRQNPRLTVFLDDWDHNPGVGAPTYRFG